MLKPPWVALMMSVHIPSSLIYATHWLSCRVLTIYPPLFFSEAVLVMSNQPNELTTSGHEPDTNPSPPTSNVSLVTFIV